MFQVVEKPTCRTQRNGPMSAFGGKEHNLLLANVKVGRLGGLVGKE